MAPGLTAVVIAQMQEQRKSAAMKIAVWYKRLSETKQARQTLKAHRQLLPLSSLDKRREEEEKVAAASTIVYFLQDIQRGHSFVRAVQTFQLKVGVAVYCCLRSRHMHTVLPCFAFAKVASIQEASSRSQNPFWGVLEAAQKKPINRSYRSIRDS